VRTSLSWLIVALFGALLVGHAATPAAVYAQDADITSIVNAFIAGENAHDVDGVTSLFADNATVVLATGPLQGTDQIRAWQQELADGHFSIQLTSPLNITGSKATYSVTVALDAFRQLGFASLDGTEDMVVENGKITSFTFAFTPEAGAAFGAALAAATTVGMPTTGSPTEGAYLWVALLAGLALCTAGYTLRRKAGHRA
jgi:hypothetical protein